VTNTDFPNFRYHPDPLESGSVVASELRCDVCGQERGYLYDGPVFAEASQVTVCPWCIADGSAATKFDATFVDAGPWCAELPDNVVREVRQRTPGFSGWDTERWLTCHSDAMAFLGPCGAAELAEHQEALEALEADALISGVSADEIDQYVASLDSAGSPTGYLFRCLECGRTLAYSDRS
jgi:uncharacterized protein CbrC (UPF0167 family)